MKLTTENLVEFESQICEVLAVNKYGVEIKLNDGHPTFSRFEDVKPIPITEEWLLKFGFEFSFGINNRYLKDYGAFYFTIMIMNDDKSYQVSLSNHEKKEGEPIPVVGLGIIKHIHELQNLYFALTKKEL